MNLPEDIKSQWSGWFNVARQLQCEARKQEGYVIAKCILLLNADGVPVHWLEPKMIKVYPKRVTNVKEICDTLEVYEDLI